ncbi:MAG: hypothetical protein IT374_13615 [Polyangiaceae bacterium]|nr:hypothetical protein [Polyangiaceae bacterium]
MTQLEGIRAWLASTGVVPADAFDRVVRGRAGALGELVTAELVTWPALVDAIASGFSLPRVTPSLLRPTRELIELVPFEIACEHGVLPALFRVGDAAPGTLTLAMSDPTDGVALAACSHGGAVRVRPMLATPRELGAALLAFYGRAPQAPPRPPPPARAVSLAPPARPVSHPPPDTDKEIELADDEVEETPDSVPPVAPAPHAPPLVLVVGGDVAFGEAVEQAARAAGVECMIADLFAASSLVRSLAPRGIVVGDDAYAFDRVAFHRLASEVGATLIVWDERPDAEEVAAVLALLAGAHATSAPQLSASAE